MCSPVQTGSPVLSHAERYQTRLLLFQHPDHGSGTAPHPHPGVHLRAPREQRCPLDVHLPYGHLEAQHGLPGASRCNGHHSAFLPAIQG